MIFMSLVFAAAFALILIIGVVNLVTSVTLAIIWIVRAAKKKKTSIVLKIFFVVCFIVGFLCFILPIGISVVSDVKKSIKYDNIQNKVYSDENTLWSDDGFEYKGKYLQKLDFGTYGKIDGEKVGAIILSEKSKDYIWIYLLKSSSGYDIYSVQGCLYADKKDIDKINKYYYETAELKAEISWYFNDEKIEKDIDFDKNILFDLLDQRTNKIDDFSCDVEDVDHVYDIAVYSSDELFYKNVHISKIGEELIIDTSSGGGKKNGIKIDDDHYEYVKDRLREYGVGD